ncbi:hypothetical protein Peur_058089 [Populus x canadensis]
MDFLITSSKILPWGSRKWGCNETYCQHDHGSMMATFSEGLLLSEKVGLDPNVLVEVVSLGAISAPMYSL